jgi:hypothetical protein
MTVTIQSKKNIDRIDILLMQLQSQSLSPVVNVTKKEDTITIELERDPTEKERQDIENMLTSFDDSIFKKIESERPMTILSTPKEFEKNTFWTIICSWKFQGTYMENLNRIGVTYLFVSNKTETILNIRVYDSTNNMVIATNMVKDVLNSSLQEQYLEIETSKLPYLPATFEVHVMMSSPKDTVTIKEVTAIYTVL